jgi:hypothetical protein
MDLSKLTAKARHQIVYCLRDHGTCNGQELEKTVIGIISMRKNRDGTVIHDPKPIHCLAFIQAYKELEEIGDITIKRPSDIPFPMTDFRTIFDTS